MSRSRRSACFALFAAFALLAAAGRDARAQAAPDCDPKVSPGCAPAAPPAYPYPYPSYQPGQAYPLPPPVVNVPSHVELKPRWGLVTGGLITWGVAYTMSLYGVAFSHDGVMAIPVVGPFVEIANYRKRFDCASPPLGSVYYCRQESGGDSTLYALLVMDGLIQAGGLALAATGLFTKQEVRVWDVKMTLLPSVNPQGAGLSAFGTF